MVVETNCEKMVMVIVKNYGIQVIRISILILFLLVPGMDAQSGPSFLLYTPPAKNKITVNRFPGQHITSQDLITIKPYSFYYNLLSLTDNNPEKFTPQFYKHNYHLTLESSSGKRVRTARMNGPPLLTHSEDTINQPFKSKATHSSHGSFRIQDDENLLCSTENFPGAKYMALSGDYGEGFSVLAGVVFSEAEQQTGWFSCPADISTYTDINSCSSFISGNLNPEFDTDSIKTLTWEMTGASAEVSRQQGINLIDAFEFEEGVTHITYTATNLRGQTSTCSFTVTISDNQVPRLADMPDISVGTNAGECSSIVYWNEPAASDNCTPAYLIRKIPSVEPGSAFPTGTTTVTYTAFDAMGNESAVQSFTVTVRDNEPPELVLPADITIDCGDELPAAWQNLTQLSPAGGYAADNCDVNETSLRLLSENRDNETCPYTITRTYQVSDVNGNTATAVHQIFVEGEEDRQEPVTLKSGMAVIISTATGGNWNSTATWEGGIIPVAGDNVTIATGATVIIDGAAECNDITIESGGTLNHSGATTLQVNGNWTDNGTYDWRNRRNH